MAKNLFKEIIIALLLCLAIILLLGILLYDYVPATKTVPNPVSYQTPDSVKQELAESTTINEEQVIMTYEVDSTDLNNYKRIQNYKPGKANPFSSYETTETSGTNTTTNNASQGGTNASNGASNNSTSGMTSSSTTNTTSGNGTTTQENNTSGGTFFPYKGIK